jgi:hypothetical protein
MQILHFSSSSNDNIAQKKKENQFLLNVKRIQKNALIYWLFSLFLLIILTIFYVIPQWNRLNETINEIEEISHDVDQKKFEKKEVEDDLKTSYQIREKVEKDYENIIAWVLPRPDGPESFQEIINIVASLFEDYSQFPRGTKVFKMNTISFGEPKFEDGYFRSSVRMSIETDEGGFNSFLDFITEKSGSFEEKHYWEWQAPGDNKRTAHPIPMMSVNSFSVQMNKEKKESPNEDKPERMVTIEISLYLNESDWLSSKSGGKKK